MRSTRTRSIAGLLLCLLWQLGPGQRSAAAQVDAFALRLVPADATFVGSMNMRALAASSVENQLRQSLPLGSGGDDRFEAETGISIERDIDRLFVFLLPGPGGDVAQSSGLVMARGRFLPERSEELMRSRGATIEDYRGRRLLIAPAAVGIVDAIRDSEPMGVTFLEAGLALVGSVPRLREAIDRILAGGAAAGPAELLRLVEGVADGDLWAIGRFDLIGAQAQQAGTMGFPLPPIDWLTFSAHVNGSMRAVLGAEARDEASAQSLKELVEGFLVLGRLQVPKLPGLEALFDSVQLTITGKRVALGFAVPTALLESLPSPAVDPQR